MNESNMPEGAPPAAPQQPPVPPVDPQQPPVSPAAIDASLPDDEALKKMVDALPKKDLPRAYQMGEMIRQLVNQRWISGK
jgi:hypothetical protein